MFILDQNCRSYSLGGLWALSRQFVGVRVGGISRICMPKSNSLAYSFRDLNIHRDLSVHHGETDKRTSGRTDRPPKPVTPRIYILYGSGNASFCLAETLPSALLHTLPRVHSTSKGYKSVEQFQEVLKQQRYNNSCPIRLVLSFKKVSSR